MHNGKRYALVAGGSGFIGSHLVDSLVSDGWLVDVMDNMSTGRAYNLKHLVTSVTDGEKSVILYPYDIRTVNDPARVDNLGYQSRYDVVYNMACPASPVAYQSDGIGTVMTNVVGTANLLVLAANHRATFVQASTSEVYGDPNQHPQHEDYWGNVNPFGPRACYDEGKRCAETLCWEYMKVGVDVRVARIFNTYGPRMDPYDGRVVSNFVRQAILGEPVTVYGDGEQTRSFCYVSDMVVALRMLAECKNAPKTPVNVGNDAEFKIMELAEMLSEWFPKLLVVNEPLPKDDPKLRKPDLRMAKSLGYKPKVTLREGLDNTITWMKSTLNSQYVNPKK